MSSELNNFTFEIHSSFSKKIRKEWYDLELSINEINPFQSYDWLSIWQSGVGSVLLKVKPQIVFIRYNKKLVAVLPLSIRKVFGIKILEWIGGINSDYLGPICLSNIKNNNNIKDLWNKIESCLINHDFISFQKMKNDSIRFIKKIGYKYSFKENNKSFQLLFDFDNPDPFHFLKKKIKADTKRQVKRLDKLGKLVFYTATTKKEKIIIIDKMIEQKKRRYNETGVWNMFSNISYVNFYKKLSELDSNYFNIHCSALSINNKILATHVGMYNKNEYLYLMPTYEGGKYKKYSLGRVLLMDLLKLSYKKKIKIFDFTIGGEQYKKDWCNLEMSLFESVKFKNTKGAIYFSYLRIKDKAKKTTFVPYLYNFLLKIFRK